MADDEEEESEDNDEDEKLPPKGTCRATQTKFEHTTPGGAMHQDHTQRNHKQKSISGRPKVTL